MVRTVLRWRPVPFNYIIDCALLDLRHVVGGHLLPEPQQDQGNGGREHHPDADGEN